MNSMNGIAASAGIAIAPAFIVKEHDYSITKTQIVDIDAEISKLNAALNVSLTELQNLKDRVLHEAGEKKAKIFEAHLLILNDPELIEPIKDKIKTESVNAEYALHEVASGFIRMFENMKSNYLKERASDMRDVTKRVLNHLLGTHHASLAEINTEVIVIAEDLTPSDTAQLNRQFVKGFVTIIGGRTSHSAIMARSLEIPAVVGLKTGLELLNNGDTVIVDGLAGTVIVNPTEQIVAEYKKKQAEYALRIAEWKALKEKPTITADGKHVELAANIGTPADIDAVLEHGGEGVGLYRTEFLYMGREEMPTEEAQYNAYKTVLEKMKGKPIVVRTLDIGGDKELPYLNMQKEMNPFLGLRAVRLCLSREDIFRPQIRALLRASVYGNLRIMFPMIATLEEFRAAKAILLQEKEKLQSEGIAVSQDIQLGIMVEIPSTAVLADMFAKEVDFFSIGTNDLIQYTMAADRMNEHVSYLYQPYHPAILRLVKNVIDSAHAHGKWVGMCGEMAGDPTAIPLLIGLGLDEFSMSATSILPARSQISGLSAADMKQLVEQALKCSTTDEVIELVKGVNR